MLKLLGTFLNLSISSLPTLDFKLAKSTFLVNYDVSTPVAFFKSAFVTQLDKSNSSFTLPPEDFFSMSFLSIQLLKELS